MPNEIAEENYPGDGNSGNYNNQIGEDEDIDKEFYKDPSDGVPPKFQVKCFRV